MRQRDDNFNEVFPLRSLLSRTPDAVSYITGSRDYPGITGSVLLYQTRAGVVVWAEMRGLPAENEICKNRVFGFHIHGGSDCAENSEEPYPLSGSHYDPHDCIHPYHAGDLPPLFGNDGLAVSVFLTNRFKVTDVIGKVIIIHGSPDDFVSQPSGNAGEKIACGVINRIGRRRKMF
ncbi:MAG: superoxide dismutase family protein [Clostridia bacterium]|nr:superoxide dismutase family protein [Clostridia bacterium]